MTNPLYGEAFELKLEVLVIDVVKGRRTSRWDESDFEFMRCNRRIREHGTHLDHASPYSRWVARKNITLQETILRRVRD